MSEERTAGAAEADDSEPSAPRTPSGQMLYHLFSAEERRKIVSIFLDNHAVAFSAAGMADATGMSEATAAGMMDSLVAAGVLAEETPNEAYQIAGSEDPAVRRIAGDLDEDPKFYRLDKDSDVANALGKADAAARERSAEFIRTAPDIDRD